MYLINKNDQEKALLGPFILGEIKTRPQQDACLHKTQTSRINGTCRLKYDATLLRRVPSKKETCS